MSIDLEGLANRDKKIIRENEGVAPYDLLTLGLSQKGYDKLIQKINENDKEEAPAKIEEVLQKHIESRDNSKTEIIQPTKVEATDKSKVITPISKAVANYGSVKVQNLTNGKVLTTTAYFAKILIKNGKYKIV